MAVDDGSPLSKSQAAINRQPGSKRSQGTNRVVSRGGGNVRFDASIFQKQTCRNPPNPAIIRAPTHATGDGRKRNDRFGAGPLGKRTASYRPNPVAGSTVGVPRKQTFISRPATSARGGGRKSAASLETSMLSEGTFNLFCLRLSKRTHELEARIAVSGINFDKNLFSALLPNSNQARLPDLFQVRCICGGIGANLEPKASERSVAELIANPMGKSSTRSMIMSLT